MYGSCFFFFKQKTAYELGISYWSSYVCSSDLQGGIGQAFLKTDALRRQRRMAAQGIEFAKVLGCDPAAFVRQPVKSQSRDHVGTGAIEIQRADMSEPFDQA